MIVLDSHIFAKLLISESDTAAARELIHAIQSAALPVVLPTLFTYEVVQIGRYHDLNAQAVLDFMETQLLSNWSVAEPNRAQWNIAEKISLKGNDRSGYPAMYDSIYHALALEKQGCFITADKEHFAKANSFGNICLLARWKDALAPMLN